MSEKELPGKFELLLEPGKFKVKNLVLISKKNIDIQHIYNEINIYEDIFHSTYYGTIVITDANNIISGTYSLPLLGNEYVFIDLIIPNVQLNEDFPKEYIHQRLRLLARVVDIEKRQLINERSQQFILHFVQEEMLTDQKIRLSKSYRNLKYKDMIESILKEISPQNFRYDLEDTMYLYNMIVPYWHPFKAINWMTSRSLSPQWKSAGFLFYTTIFDKGFKAEGNQESNWFFLKHIESMLAADGFERKVFFQPANIRPARGDAHYSSDFSSITTYEIVQSFNVLENLSSGFFGNNLITHDLQTKSWARKKFNYEKEFPTFQHTDSGKLLGAILDPFGKKFSDYPDATWRFYSKDKAMECNNHIEKVTLNRLSEMMSVHNFQLRFVLPGDGRTSPGDLIYFDIPSPENISLTGNRNPLDQFYSGRYLVTSMRHIFNPESYDVVYECAKESLNIDVENYQPAI